MSAVIHGKPRQRESRESCRISGFDHKRTVEGRRSLIAHEPGDPFVIGHSSFGSLNDAFHLVERTRHEDLDRVVETERPASVGSEVVESGAHAEVHCRRHPVDTLAT